MSVTSGMPLRRAISGGQGVDVVGVEAAGEADHHRRVERLAAAQPVDREAPLRVLAVLEPGRWTRVAHRPGRRRRSGRRGHRQRGRRSQSAAGRNRRRRAGRTRARAPSRRGGRRDQGRRLTRTPGDELDRPGRRVLRGWLDRRGGRFAQQLHGRGRRGRARRRCRGGARRSSRFARWRLPGAELGTQQRGRHGHLLARRESGAATPVGGGDRRRSRLVAGEPERDSREVLAARGVEPPRTGRPVARKSAVDRRAPQLRRQLLHRDPVANSRQQPAAGAPRRDALAATGGGAGQAAAEARSTPRPAAAPLRAPGRGGRSARPGRRRADEPSRWRRPPDSQAAGRSRERAARGSRSRGGGRARPPAQVAATPRTPGTSRCRSARGAASAGRREVGWTCSRRGAILASDPNRPFPRDRDRSRLRPPPRAAPALRAGARDRRRRPARARLAGGRSAARRPGAAVPRLRPASR